MNCKHQQADDQSKHHVLPRMKVMTSNQSDCENDVGFSTPPSKVSQSYATGDNMIFSSPDKTISNSPTTFNIDMDTELIDVLLFKLNVGDIQTIVQLVISIIKDPVRSAVRQITLQSLINKTQDFTATYLSLKKHFLFELDENDESCIYCKAGVTELWQLFFIFCDKLYHLHDDTMYIRMYFEERFIFNNNTNEELIDKMIQFYVQFPPDKSYVN